MALFRMPAVRVALACATALGGGVAMAVAQPASATAASAAAPAQLPAHVFAPYYFNTTDTLAATAKASGAKYLTLAFLQTAKPGSCTVYWNGDTKQPVGPTYAKGIAAIQADGGTVVPSFGGAGADSADTELADSCTSVPAIAAQYEKVIEAYHASRIDLDTEENSLNNYAGIDRRNKAIAMVERWATVEHHVVQFVYTLPTNTTGLDQGGSYVLQNAVANGARIAIVNAMTFDYYDNLPHEIGDETEGAAIQIYDRLHELYPGKTAAQLWGMIGVTEDLGVDDFGAAETLTLADAHTVEQWAAARGLAELSFWNVQDDNTAGSHVKQSAYEYSHLFEPFTSSAARSSQSLAAASSVAQHGNFRSVSCPVATFCMAVDESGSNALTWNGASWSEPVPVEAGGTGVELTHVSCAGPGFCVAVDTLGRALTWNGASWTGTRIDRIGLTSVSCPSDGFCVAVDGDGGALTWTGGSWSAPARIDRTGSSLQSVSCVSASYCAAGDWLGNTLTWTGAKWSAPTAVDPAGGGVSTMSCASATFCVGTDWQGGEVTWNGAKWALHATFDANAAGGLMSVSCLSGQFCMATDGSGDYLTWDGAKWSRPAMVDLTGDGIESVSCGTTTFCMAVDWNGNALIFDGTTWAQPAISCPASTAGDAGKCTTRGSYTDPRAGLPDAVSCPAPGFCAAVDQNGNALVTGSTWSDIDPIAGILTSVSCGSASFCAAVDTNGYALTFDGRSWSVPVWSAAAPQDRRAPLTSVSCPSAAFCMAVDGNGNALRFGGHGWTAPAATGVTGLTGVSCTGPSFCAAVSAGGDLLRWDGHTWVVTASTGIALTGVSCVAGGFCAAVGAGDVVVEHIGVSSGGGFSEPVRAGLTAVSCASARYCVAVSGSGAVLKWNGARWSSPTTVDPSGGGLTSVSCPASGPCVATDFDGRLLKIG